MMHAEAKSIPLHPRRSTRKGAPKSRTGCLPCKRRHKKCDETDPACLRCQQSGLTCDYGFNRRVSGQGQRPLLPLVAAQSSSSTPTSTAPLAYHHHQQQQQPQPQQQQSSATVPARKRRRRPPLPVAPLSHPVATAIALTPMESLYLDRFQIRAKRIRTAYGGECELWYRTMLREGSRDDAVRHCLVAIGALDYAHDGDPIWKRSSGGFYGAESDKLAMGPLFKLGEVGRERSKAGAQSPMVNRSVSSASRDAYEECYSNKVRHREHAAQSYGRAIQSLQTRLSLLAGKGEGPQQEELRRTLLIANILFIVLETMQGNTDAANGLFMASIKLLKEHLVGKSAPAKLMGPTASALDDDGLRQGKLFMLRAAAVRRMCSPSILPDGVSCGWTAQMQEFRFDVGDITTVPEVSWGSEQVGRTWDQLFAYAMPWLGVAQTTAVQYAEQEPTSEEDQQRRLSIWHQLQRSQASLVALCERWRAYVIQSSQSTTNISGTPPSHSGTATPVSPSSSCGGSSTTFPSTTASVKSPSSSPSSPSSSTNEDLHSKEVVVSPALRFTRMIVGLGARLLSTMARTCLDPTTEAWDAHATDCEIILSSFVPPMDRAEAAEAAGSRPAAMPTGAYMDEHCVGVVYALMGGCRTRRVRQLGLRIVKGLLRPVALGAIAGDGAGPGAGSANWSSVTVLMRLLGMCREEEKARVRIRRSGSEQGDGGEEEYDDGGIPVGHRLRWMRAEWDPDFKRLTVVNRRLGTGRDETMVLPLAEFVEGKGDMWDF